MGRTSEEIIEEIHSYRVELPERMEELWHWVVAVDAWDYCDPEPLAKLIQTDPIPPEFQPIIADVITGNRKQNRKAAAKSKVPAEDRMEVAKSVVFFSGFTRFVATRTEAIRRAADGRAMEPRDLIRSLYGHMHSAVQDNAIRYDVSIETIENLARELRRKAASWPHV